MSVPDSFVIAPKQRRSRRTLDRLLRATRELLADTVFEEISVQRIVDRAGCSVGAFYQRFPGKDAVIPHLLEIHYSELRLRVERMVAAASDSGLAERIEDVVRLLVTLAVEDRGLIRTLVLRNHQRPESIPGSIRTAAADILGTLYAFILARRADVRHPDPERAVEVGLLMVAAAVRERLVLVGTTQAATLEIDAAAFGHELAVALRSYLETSVDHRRRVQ